MHYNIPVWIEKMDYMLFPSCLSAELIKLHLAFTTELMPFTLIAKTPVHTAYHTNTKLSTDF